MQISAEGYHFNEISGKPSDSTLTLRAIYRASSSAEQVSHVNVLTHLIHNRVRQLMQQGNTTVEAIETAQTEWITSFQKVLIVDDLSNFTNLSLYDLDDQFSDGNAYLHALSAIVYQYADRKANLKENSVDAELTTVLNYLARDFADDGEISDEVILGDLATASRLVRPDNIEKNLANRSYQVTNQLLQVAQMNRFIDSDGDGVVNTEDDDDDNDGFLDLNDVTPYGTAPEQVNGNYKPLAASFKFEAEEDTSTPVTFLLNDLDGDELSLFIEQRPRYGTLEGEYPNINYTPYPNFNGEDKFSYKVSDGISDSDTVTAQVTVLPVNDPPVISGSPNKMVTAYHDYTFIPSVNDIDRDRLVYTIENLPTWMTFSTSTGTLSGKPNNKDAGDYDGITISVTDGNDTAFLEAFSISVGTNPWVSRATMPGGVWLCNGT